MKPRMERLKREMQMRELNHTLDALRKEWDRALDHGLRDLIVEDGLLYAPASNTATWQTIGPTFFVSSGSDFGVSTVPFAALQQTRKENRDA